MKRELGIARCGLACCLCSENLQCKGCRQDGFKDLAWCPDSEWCENRNCCIDRNLLACWECTDRDCRKGRFSEKIKPLGFTEYIRRYGKEDLLDHLEEKETIGVVYHREGIFGDYDKFDDIEDLIRFIRTNDPQEIQRIIEKKEYSGNLEEQE